MEEQIAKLKAAVSDALENRGAESSPELEELLWETLEACQGQPFSTLKGLEFSYRVKGYEMFVDRKNKSLTKSTVFIAFQKALELQKDGGPVKGPKKLGTFGASYIYPVFIQLGVIRNRG